MTVQNECYYSRECFVIFPPGDDPFDALLRLSGSDDLVLTNPSVVIPAYSELDSISVVVFFLKFPDSPLQPMR